MKTRENWHKNLPSQYVEHEDITVLCNQGVRTYKDVTETRPDIIIIDKKGL
jgi:hypothetical protein